jgi:hypothetical protein
MGVLCRKKLLQNFSGITLPLVEKKRRGKWYTESHKYLFLKAGKAYNNDH